MSKHRRRQLDGLVIAQISIAVVLLVGSGLMVRSMLKLSKVHPGFEAGGRLSARVALPRAEYPTSAARAQFFSTLARRMRDMPGVASAALVSRLPLQADGNDDSAIWIEGVTVGADALPPVLKIVQVTDGYFDTMAIPVENGRDFQPSEQVTPNNAVVVSRQVAERFWPNADAIGKRLRPSPDGAWYEVVGVVGDVRMDRMDAPASSAVYFPLTGAANDSALSTNGAFSMVLRSEHGGNVSVEPLHEVVRLLDPQLPIFNVASVQSVIDGSTARMRFAMMSLAVAALTALLLGSVGIYGVISYLVSLRIREIGVRLALGAPRQNIAWMVLRQGATVAGIGIAIGVSGSLLLAWQLNAVLFGVSPFDPIVHASAAILLMCVTLAASAVPGVRAASLDPAYALRNE